MRQPASIPHRLLALALLVVVLGSTALVIIPVRNTLTAMDNRIADDFGMIQRFGRQQHTQFVRRIVVPAFRDGLVSAHQRLLDIAGRGLEDVDRRLFLLRLIRSLLTIDELTEEGRGQWQEPQPDLS